MIAIPNIDKPKQCYDCRLISSAGLNCRVTQSKVEWSTVNDDCPLIEIDDSVWEHEKYRLIRMSQEIRINKDMQERRTDERDNL